MGRWEDDTPNQTTIKLPCYALSPFLIYAFLILHGLCVSGFGEYPEIADDGHHRGIGLFVRMGVTNNCVRQSDNQAISPAPDQPEPDIRPPASHLSQAETILSGGAFFQYIFGGSNCIEAWLRTRRLFHGSGSRPSG